MIYKHYARALLDFINRKPWVKNIGYELALVENIKKINM